MSNVLPLFSRGICLRYFQYTFWTFFFKHIGKPNFVWYFQRNNCCLKTNRTCQTTNQTFQTVCVDYVVLFFGIYPFFPFLFLGSEPNCDEVVREYRSDNLVFNIRLTRICKACIMGSSCYTRWWCTWLGFWTTRLRLHSFNVRVYLDKAFKYFILRPSFLYGCNGLFLFGPYHLTIFIF